LFILLIANEMLYCLVNIDDVKKITMQTSKVQFWAYLLLAVQVHSTTHCRFYL